MCAVPQADAPSLPGFGEPGSDEAAIMIGQLHGFAEKFTDVTVQLPGGLTARGWVRNICAS
ncbi:MAG: hypothetical protein EXR05_05860 [Acetobacteraceae bacterium]|nr:hypothetical protein [Acetobacteraceae bacterium]MSP29602.1 hypothetical protein [Acetobacteraceae bacterium]